MFVFNAQLNNLFWNNPDIRPELHGHAQIKLWDDGQGAFNLEVRGKLVNPDGVGIGTGTIAFIGSTSGSIIEFIDNPDFMHVTSFFDSDTISSSLARLMIDDPNLLVARINFDGGELTGQFH